MDTTLNESQITRMAKAIFASSLASFYSNPANAAAFEKWKAEKEEKGND